MRAGAQDQIKEFDTELWASCMLEESKGAPTLYPHDFGLAATTILHHLLGLTPQRITHTNCRNIYLTLVHWIDNLMTNRINVCSSLNTDINDDDCTDDDRSE